MQEVKIDVVRQNVPQFYYKRLDVNNLALGYFIIPIDIGYAYLLRTVKTKYSVWVEEVSLLSMKVEFIQQHAGRELQSEPIPFNLFSTPNNAGATLNNGVATPGVTVNAAPQPVDNTAFDVNFSANPVKNNMILNYFYQRREDLYLKISFEPEVIRNSGYIDILLCGYLIPDFTVKEWE